MNFIIINTILNQKNKWSKKHMAIQWGKMILHGLLSAVLYIGIPYGLIYLLEYLNLITFTEAFKIAIIVLGVVGTVISMIKHAYPKDTSANRLISFPQELPFRSRTD